MTQGAGKNESARRKCKLLETSDRNRGSAAVLRSGNIFSWQSRELVKLDGLVETLLARADADAFAS